MFLLTIAAIDTVLFRGTVTSVNCPAVEGEVTILSHHTPFITSLKKGSIRAETFDKEQKVFFIEKGLLAVHKNEAVILI